LGVGAQHTPQMTPTPKYIKLIRKNKTHNGFVFKKGLNKLKGRFEKHPNCGSGGLYFCEEHDIFEWTSMYWDTLGYIAEVTLCPDSKVVKMPNKLKTDKFILGEFKDAATYIAEFLDNSSDDKLMEYIMRAYLKSYLKNDLFGFHGKFSLNAIVVKRGEAFITRMITYSPETVYDVLDNPTEEQLKLAITLDWSVYHSMPSKFETPQLEQLMIKGLSDKCRENSSYFVHLPDHIQTNPKLLNAMGRTWDGGISRKRKRTQPTPDAV